MRELTSARGAKRWLPLRRTAALAATATLAALGVAATAAPAGAAASAARAGVAAAPAAPAVASALAAGPVSPPGLATGILCAPGCDLFAKAGTTTVGGVALPVWNFTNGDVTVTGANPVIIANQGDTLAITVHNTLSTALALSVPGISGLVPDYVGTPAGTPAVPTTKTYTFVVDRPGTFIYQAGRLGGLADPGPRQVAMGLAGALVVRPTGLPNQVLGVAAPLSAFDDEAVMVLSEIDPLFAANPATYDLRLFRGTYRLVNGAAFPETTQVSTAVNHKVLLRYVNAGVSSASLGPIGLKQSIVAANGYPATGAALVADTIAAGSTEDAIVTMPATDSNVLVVDSTGGLNTNGQFDSTTVPSTRQLGFGGRMTVLTTTGGLGGTNTPPTSDVVGPNASALTVTPNPATVTAPVTVTATFTDLLVNGFGPSNVTAGEVFVDSLGAVGTGIAMTGAFGTPVVTGATATIPPATLAALNLTLSPTHVIFVRGQDSVGNWGPATPINFTIPNGLPKTTGLTLTPAVTNGLVNVALTATGDDSALGGTVATMQYQIDAGPFLAMALNNPAAAIAIGSATIPAATVAALSAGTHTVTVRTTDSPLGLQGTGTVTLTVDKTAPAVTTTGTVDPNPTNGSVGSPVDPTSLKVQAGFTDPATPVASSLVAAEGFLNNPLGVSGTGFVFVATDGAFNSAVETAYGLIPISEVTALADGTNHVFVHAKDAAGNWGTLTDIPFVVDKTRPTLAALGAIQQGGAAGRFALTGTVTNPGTGATALVAAEAFVGTTDPGVGLGIPVTLPVFGATTFTGTVSGLPLGLAQRLNVRVKDAAGNWSLVAFTTVNVLAEPIFSDTFNVPGPGGGPVNTWVGSPWAPTGAPVRVAATAALGLDGTRAMVTTTAATPSYVTTPVLTAGGTNPVTNRYLARFLFNPSTLVTGGPVLTPTPTRITSLRSNGNERGAIWYRRATAASAPQIALTVNNAAPTGATVWTTLPNPAGGNTIRIDWTSSGTVRLYLNGTPAPAAVQVATAATANLAQTVDRVLLGEITGATGAAYFDRYTASRFLLPQP
jgi:hypothetical protein